MTGRCQYRPGIFGGRMPMSGRRAERCAVEPRYLIMAGTEAGAAYSGGYWICGRHLPAQLEACGAKMLSPRVDTEDGFKISVYEREQSSLPHQYRLICTIRPRNAA